MNKKTSWEEQTKRIEESVRLQDEARGQYVELIESLRCVICGKPGGHRRLWGGREVALCNAHANAWHEFLVGQPFWVEKAELEAKYDVAVYGDAVLTAIKAKHRIMELQAECYELSGKWLGMAIEQHDVGD